MDQQAVCLLAVGYIPSVTPSVFIKTLIEHAHSSANNAANYIAQSAN